MKNEIRVGDYIISFDDEHIVPKDNKSVSIGNFMIRTDKEFPSPLKLGGKSVGFEINIKGA